MSSIPPSSPGDSSNSVQPITPATKASDRRARPDEREPEPRKIDDGVDLDMTPDLNTPRALFGHLRSIFEPTTYSPKDIDRKLSVNPSIFDIVLAWNELEAGDRKKVTWWQEYQGILLRNRDEARKALGDESSDTASSQSE